MKMSHLLSAVVAFGFAVSGALAQCGDPDPSAVVLDDADIFDIDGGDMITVIADPFEDDSLIGHWIAVRTTEDLPIEFFRIISNEHFDQNNISVFTVAEDLEHAGGSNWWLFDGQNTFDIVAPIEGGASTEDPTFTDTIKRVNGSKLKHVSATVSFPNGSQVGQWIGVIPVAGQPEQFFEILSNTTKQRRNGKWVNTFVVDGDLQGAGAANWWKVTGQDEFTIYEPCD